MPKKTTSKRTWTEESLRSAVSDSSSIRQVLNKLGLVEAGGNYSSIKSWIKELGLETSHFHGQGWAKGGKNKPFLKRRPLEEILVENSSYKSTHLKKRLLSEGLLEAKCYNCGITEWLGNPAPLELEHRNGIRDDNRIENLEILCPNCHALTPTYRGRNIRLGSPKAGDNGLKNRTVRVRVPLQVFCPCGKKISKRASRCKPCAGISTQPTKILWPSADILQTMVAESSFSEVGRKLGVSDNTVRKHLLKDSV